MKGVNVMCQCDCLTITRFLVLGLKNPIAHCIKEPLLKMINPIKREIKLKKKNYRALSMIKGTIRDYKMSR